MRRWIAWRRQTDELAGQGTYDLALETLRGLVELLAPGKPLPDSYRRLRGLVDPIDKDGEALDDTFS